jgi:tripeptidyl-peptidase-1
VGEPTKFALIDGGRISPNPGASSTETILDLDLAMSLTYPLNVTMFNVGQNSYNNFLDAIDSSYCSGEDPTIDGTFPNAMYNHIRDVSIVSQAKFSLVVRMLEY